MRKVLIGMGLVLAFNNCFAGIIFYKQTCYSPLNGLEVDCDYRDTHIPNTTNCQRMDMHDLVVCSPYVSHAKESGNKIKKTKSEQING